MELLKTLIRIESSTKASANEAILYCSRWLETQGIQTKNFDHNGYKSVVSEIGSGSKTLIFNGHLDVVSAKSAQFSPYEEDGKLYGRGSADMKAGVSAMMCVLADLKNKSINCKIQLQLVSDEEDGDNCSKSLTDEGYIGDFVICGEPTNLGIGVQSKGILQIDIGIFGKSAHGSRPWQGENAILKAYEIFNLITKLPFAKEKSELYDFPSINLSKIDGGDVYNKVPHFCKMSLDIRFLPQQNIGEIIDQIKSIAGGEEITIFSEGDPVKTDINDLYVKKLLESISSVSNKKNAITFGQHGSSDTRFFSRFNIPAVEFGPCGENWHGDDEYVTIDSVVLYKDILEEFALNFE
jgi:succinyl-diaminopimelate desuccinylase